MTLRAGHGRSGKKHLVKVEVLPADEQPSVPANAPAPLETGRDAAGRVRTSEAARALAKLPRRKGFLPAEYQADPQWESFDRGRLEWLAARRAEVCDQWGGVSVGVDAKLVNASWEHAAAQFLFWRGSQTLEADLFKSASQLAAAARQNTLAAHELSARERPGGLKGPSNPFE